MIKVKRFVVNMWRAFVASLSFGLCAFKRYFIEFLLNITESKDSWALFYRKLK